MTAMVRTHPENFIPIVR